MSIQRPKIEIGYRVGMLTVIERTDQRKNRYSVWRCQCDCGGNIDLDTRCLQRRTVTDCGCKAVVRPGMLDLTGQRFGKLVCLKPSEEKDKQNNTQWICRCDCGNICTAALHQLRSGYKKSCGCLSHPPLKEYIGKRFNKLIVVEYAGKEKGMHHWKCLCDCGNITIVGQTQLQSGKTKSCGCLKYVKIQDLGDNIFFKGFLNGTNIGTIKARMTNDPIASNTSGHNGVYKNTRGKWIAQITFKRRTYYLGSFSKIEDAVAARKKGEEMFEEFLDWYYNVYLQSEYLFPKQISGVDNEPSL